MAVSIVLRVGDTSAQDVALTSAGVAVLEYPMNSPDINQQALQNLGDGNTLGVPSFSNVTESLELHISDTTAALVAAKVQAIERLLDLARQGSMGMFDNKLYVRLQFDNDTLVWRSQILAARLEMEQGTDQIWRKYIRATLIITRRFYWETEALQALEVSSGTTTTATTGYATVYNSDDTHATQRNWFQIAAAQLTGSLPAPAKISVKNISGAERNCYSVYLGNYAFCDPTNIDPVWRAESATLVDTSIGTTEQDFYAWDMSNGIVDDFRGQFGRSVVVFSDRPEGTTLLRAALQYRGPTPQADLALGEQMLDVSQDFVMDLGALPIPPSGYAAGMGDRLYLTLKGKAASGTDTVGVDWLQIFPSGAGRYRVLKGIFGGLTLESNNEVVDDGPAGAVYLATTGDEVLPLYRPLYTPIYLWPNRVQRLRLLISGGSFAFETGQPWGVKCEYRPRRVSF